MAVTDSTGICNLALDTLKEAPISALTDSRAIARWLNRNYDTTRDSLLRKVPWRFAIKIVEVTKDGTNPDFGWSYAYDLPADCLRPLPLTVDGKRDNQILRSEVIGSQIQTNAASPIKLRYIYQNVTVTEYPSDFIEALAAVLAMKMAHWLTGKSNYAGIAKEAYQEALNNAYLTDAIEGDGPAIDDYDIIAARL